MLSGKSALWKNIGKEDTIKQYQSSISSSNKPVKAFHIMFQDDNPSKSDGQSSSQLKKHEEGLLYYDNPNISMRGQQDNEGSPMIITVDNGYNKQQNEQVLEVISFDSQYQNGNHQMNQILASFTEFQENSHKTKRKSFASFQLPAINKNDRKQREFQTSKFFAVLQNIRDLKDQISLHKKQSQNAIQKCRSQFINYLLNMKQALIARQKNISSTQTLSKPDQLKYSEQMNRKYSTLQQQGQNLNQTLSFERQAREVARRQKRDIQQKLRKVERTQKQQRNRLGSEQAIIDDLKVRINRLQIQLKQARLQCQNNTARVPKLKQVIKERQLLINSRNNQVVELQKKVKSMAISLEDKNSKQHRLELQLKGLKERLQKQSGESNKEVSKYKGQIQKLKTLLKTSEQQLSNCEEYINRLNFELKEQQSQNQKMRQKTKQTEILFHKKLQQYESYLAQLQNNISQMSLAQQQKQQELSNKQDELYRIRQEFQNKILEVKGKQDELQQIKKQIDFKMMSLERKEDGLKAEYKMVLQNQNAVKDKWYERYYAMFSPERQKRYQSPPIYSPAQRDVNPLSGRSSFNRKDQIDLQELEVRSSNRQKLYKVKSQKNICINPSTSNFYRSDVIKTSRNDRDLTSSPTQLTGLGSRINNLRRELTRELGQISQH